MGALSMAHPAPEIGETSRYGCVRLMANSELIELRRETSIMSRSPSIRGFGGDDWRVQVVWPGDRKASRHAVTDLQYSTAAADPHCCGVHAQVPPQKIGETR
jgi:hypothetical protein